MSYVFIKKRRCNTHVRRTRWPTSLCRMLLRVALAVDEIRLCTYDESPCKE